MQLPVHQYVYSCFLTISQGLEHFKEKKLHLFIPMHIEQTDFLFCLFLFTVFLLKFRDRILDEKSNMNLEPEDLELLSHERTMME